MTALNLTAYGQTTLHKDVLNHPGIELGDKVALETLPDGRPEMTAVKPTGKISDLFRIFHREDGPVLTIEDINGAIEQGGPTPP